MTAKLTYLIDKLDNFEIIESKIAAIFVEEIANQKVLALAASKDPALWDVRIFTERSNPWEMWLNDQEDIRPICNIWYDSETADKSKSNIMSRQQGIAVYNLDCYGFGISSNNESGGHNPGDFEASEISKRTAKLIRNIIMSAPYAYLDMRGTVASRWLRNKAAFQPEINGQQIQQVQAIRLALEIGFNELTTQLETQLLEYISVTIKRTETGEILSLIDIDLT